jgi:apolipoprotein N-acyltransferase
VGALLALAWVERARPRVAIGSLVGVAVLVTAGGVIPLPVEGEVQGGPSAVTVAVIQGNVPGAGMDALGEREAVLRNHVRETEVLAADVAAGRAPAPALVIWPENSSDIDPLTDSAASALIQQAVDSVDVPVLVGAVVEKPDDPTRILNMGIVWEPTSSGAPGPAGYYVKQHPVPFGEWVPARDLLARLIGRFDRVPRDFAPGSRTGVVQVGPARVGDLICFEVAYDGLARAAVRGDGVEGPGADGLVDGDGARVLAVQTNNATYGLTGQPEQQLAMSRLRAVEHGRAVLVAATSGISAIVAPDGSLAGVLPENTAGYLVQDVPLRDTLTVADVVGPWPEYAAVALAVALLVLAAVRRRAPRDVGSGSVQQTEEAV